MATFYLVRHGEALWSLATERRLKGAANDLVPLTPRGIHQIERAAERLRPLAPALVLSSPMTGALQSAAVLSRQLDLPLAVEFDLHEWVPDTTYSWDSVAPVLAASEEMSRLGGEWPAGETRLWEPLSAVRRRVVAVLQRYAHLQRVAVLCHEVVIQSLTGSSAAPGEMRGYQLHERT